MLVALLLCNPQNTPISNKFKHNVHVQIEGEIVVNMMTSKPYSQGAQTKHGL
jgi:hypothetical protein